MKHFRRGFTLIEMVMVIAVSGLMVGFLLSDHRPKISNPDCYLATKSQLEYINAKIRLFAQNNERLPMPAKRYVNTNDIAYGREAVAGDITQNAGVSFGALPFQALGLSPSYAGDCWGNKYTYAVTTALTTSASNGGYKDTAIDGGMTLKGDSGNAINTKIAYAIISHGQDALGAVKLGYSDSSGSKNQKWCSGSANIAYTNCLASNGDGITLQSGKINDGKNAGASYFDDVIVAGGKPQILTTPYYAFGWGTQWTGGSSELGNGYKGGVNPRPVLVDTNGLSFTTVYVGGDSFSCALTAAGKAYCWGNNNYGQLGDGTTTNRISPTAVSGNLTFTSLALGLDHVCGRTSGGVVYCWGYNSNGQLGDGTIINHSTPSAVNSALTFTSVYAGSYHSCAIETVNSYAYCWGKNNTGQVGDNTLAVKLSPTATNGNKVFTTLGLGALHTCGLTAAGVAWCWGMGVSGQIGDNNTTSRRAPTLVSAGGVTFTSIDGGGSHTCALTAAGKAYCWGLNSSGQVGDSTTSVRKVPTAVNTSLTFSKIDAGYDDTCAITVDGIMYCWGYEIFGEWGDVDSGSNSLTAPSISNVAGHGRAYSSFSLNGSTYGYNCGIELSSGKPWCMGSNIYGELGNGTSSQQYAPTAVLGGLQFTEISGGFAQFFCGITTSNDAYCWGNNASGQLGLGVGAASVYSTPQLLPGGHKFTKIALGADSGCAITTDGAAYCWGDNVYGQGGQGNGNVSQLYSPSAVTGGLTFSTIASGEYHVCALTNAGAAYCWGNNNGGMLGDNSAPGQHEAPVAVAGGLKFSSITAGAAHTCGLTSAGAAYCWGLNNEGEVGDGSQTERDAPVPVVGGMTFSSITAGKLHTCGLTSAGAAYCWGDNSSGQLGTGATLPSFSSSPTAVLSGGLTFNFIASSSSVSTTCAITSAGVVYCWGDNSNGMAGDGTNTSPRTSPSAAVTNSGTPYLTFRKIAVARETVIGLAEITGGCTLPNSSNTVPNGWKDVFYQSSAPSGSCTAEYRSCTAGTLSGSYTNFACSNGCPAQTKASWDGVALGCQGPISSMAVGGGPTPITNNRVGYTGSGTASCDLSGTGLLTITPIACTSP